MRPSAIVKGSVIAESIVSERKISKQRRYMAGSTFLFCKKASCLFVLLLIKPLLARRAHIYRIWNWQIPAYLEIVQ